MIEVNRIDDWYQRAAVYLAELLGARKVVIFDGVLLVKELEGFQYSSAKSFVEKYWPLKEKMAIFHHRFRSKLECQ